MAFGSKKWPIQRSNAMMDFVRKLADRVIGVLSGFDRLLFRGMLRSVVDARGLNGYLYGAGVPMANFKEHAQEVTQRLQEESLRHAREIGCEVRYLESSQDRKKDLAQEIAERDGIRDGLICVLRCVEPCTTFHVRRDRETKKIALERHAGKCLHLYHYYDHPRFGLMHVRLQTWFPFTIQICLNGREWLAKDLQKAEIGYLRHDHYVHHVDDLVAAQRMLDEQLKVSWTTVLKDLAGQVHPAHEAIFANCPEHCRDYYWSVAESEWASDVLFRDPREVLPLCERLAAYSLRVHGAADVMRFFGRKLRADGRPRANFNGELQSDALVFAEGIRLKHWLNQNSVKMYNASLLRFETTINNPEEFKVWRTTEKDPDGELQWLKMRKGVADLHRRAQVSQAANDRFATAQAAALNEDPLPLKAVAKAVCKRVVRPGRPKRDGSYTRPRSFRGLNPLSSDDIQLLAIVAQPKFVISDLRNEDLRRELYGEDPADAKEKRRRSAKVGRKLAMLRAHGILEKVPKGHRYRITSQGRHVLTALLVAANATTKELLKLAA
jgi:hypothetical protein